MHGEDDDMSNFCGGCGTSIQNRQRYCHNCGAENDWGASNPVSDTSVVLATEAPHRHGELAQEQITPEASTSPSDDNQATGAISDPPSKEPSVVDATPTEVPVPKGIAPKLTSKPLCPKCGEPMGENKNCIDCFYVKEKQEAVESKKREAARIEQETPALAGWKTSIIFSLLGLFVGFPLSVAISALLSLIPTILIALVMRDGSYMERLAVPFTILIGTTAQLLYALKVYPSYFSEKPLLKSSKLISSANLAFGGVPFGLIWNGNLTKKTKGISYKVFAWSTIAYLVFLVSSWVAFPSTMPLSPSSSPSSSYSNATAETLPSSSVNVRPLEVATGGRIYTDDVTGASFAVPKEWVEVPFTEEELKSKGLTQGNGMQFDASEETGVNFFVIDVFNDVLTSDERAGLSREDVGMDYFSDSDDAEMTRAILQGSHVANPTVEIVTINSVEYISGSGSTTGYENTVHVVLLTRIDKGYMYVFQYITIAESPKDTEEENWQAFLSMVASTVFP
jgi:hypothetical protein